VLTGIIRKKKDGETEGKISSSQKPGKGAKEVGVQAKCGGKVFSECQGWKRKLKTT